MSQSGSLQQSVVRKYMATPAYRASLIMSTIQPAEGIVRAEHDPRFTPESVRKSAADQLTLMEQVLTGFDGSERFDRPTVATTMDKLKKLASGSSSGGPRNPTVPGSSRS
jgi:hypothetical protein